MRAIRVALLLALFGPSPLAAATPPAFDTSVPAPGERGDAWPASRVRFPGGVVGVPDIVYTQHLHHRPERLDLYLPADAPGARHPLLVHVHGGAWMMGTKRHGGPIRDFSGVLATFAAHGFVVASVEYRLDGEAPFPAAIKDVKEAIRYLRSHANDYGIDPARVGIWGESAGGQLSALVGTSCGVAALEPDPTGMPGERPSAPASDCVQAAAPWYGVHDFRTVPIPPDQPGPASYLGCASRRCPDAKLIAASPVTYVDPRDPPFLLIHGLADTLVAASQTRELEARLRAAEVPVETLYVRGVDHGLVGRTPAETSAANRAALDATFAFFSRTLGPVGRSGP